MDNMNIARASASPAHAVMYDPTPDRLRSASGGSGSLFSGRKAPFWPGKGDGEPGASKPPPTMAQVAEKNYERYRIENERQKRLMSSKWDFSSGRMPRSKETEARMKILVLVTTAISIIVVFLFTITYPYINTDIGYDDGPAPSFCPLLLPPHYGRLDCNSVRSLDSVKVACQVWCDNGASNTTVNSTVDGVAGVVLQITCLDSEEWGVSQDSLSALCAAPAEANSTEA